MRAALVGGYAGTWIDGRLLDGVALSDEHPPPYGGAGRPEAAPGPRTLADGSPRFGARARMCAMTDYGQPLREQDAKGNPFGQFAVWFADAQTAGERMPEAVALATASPDAVPSVRMVLVKSFDENGFVFFSNHDSQKARELAANPRAALVFHWDALGRQVRVSGPVEPATAAETRDYVRSRPRASQLSALASPQSRVIDSRKALEQLVAELRQRYGDGELPVPSNWGGYRLAAQTFEFWQQRHDRLHDRLSYRRVEPCGWAIERLAP